LYWTCIVFVFYYNFGLKSLKDYLHILLPIYTISSSRFTIFLHQLISININYWTQQLELCYNWQQFNTVKSCWWYMRSSEGTLYEQSESKNTSMYKSLWTIKGHSGWWDSIWIIIDNTLTLKYWDWELESVLVELIYIIHTSFAMPWSA
jgi:hypothetical protein